VFLPPDYLTYDAEKIPNSCLLHQVSGVCICSPLIRPARRHWWRETGGDHKSPKEPAFALGVSRTTGRSEYGRVARQFQHRRNKWALDAQM